MTKELETLVVNEGASHKVPEGTLKVLNLTGEMARTFFYEAVGVAIAGLAATVYAGYEIVSFYK